MKRKFYTSVLLMTVLSLSASGGTYYSHSTAINFNDPNSWGSNPNGLGAHPNAISSDHDFIITNGANLSLSANCEIGSLNLNAGTLNLGTFNFGVHGELAPFSTINASNATITMYGDSWLINFFGNASINNLVINTTTGIAHIYGDFNVVNNLQFIAGKVELQGLLQVNGNITGHNSGNYVATYNGGALRRLVNGTSTVFPVGATTYNPATLTNSGAADFFTIAIDEDVLTEGTTGTTVTNPVVKRSWLITEAVAGGSDVVMTLQWNSGDMINAFDLDHVYVAHYDQLQSKWEHYLDMQPGQHIHDVAPPATVVNPGVYSTSQSGITAFSPFTVASSGASPLNTTLVDISVAGKANNNILNWLTGHEDEGDRFELERGNGAVSFRSIASITGRGSNSNYSYTDTEPVEGKNYYRLKMLNAAGEATYSKVVVANTTGGPADIVLYPNPVADKLFVISGSETDLLLTDISGKIVQQIKTVRGSNTIKMNELPAGTYLLKLQDKVYRVLKN